MCVCGMKIRVQRRGRTKHFSKHYPVVGMIVRPVVDRSISGCSLPEYLLSPINKLVRKRIYRIMFFTMILTFIHGGMIKEAFMFVRITM